jgi:hypothetical protein
MWSRAIEGFSESRVSVRRVRDFLLLPEAPKRNWGSTAASTTTASTTAASDTTTAGDATAASATAAGDSNRSSVLSNGAVSNGTVSSDAVSNGAVNGDSSADHAVQQQPLLSIKDAAFSWHALTEAYAKSTAAALAPVALKPVSAAAAAVADDTTPRHSAPHQNGAASEQQHEQQPTVSNVTFDAHRGKLVSLSLQVYTLSPSPQPAVCSSVTCASIVAACDAHSTAVA